MVNKLLQLELNNRFIGNYTTDENGEALFSIDTSDIFDPEFNLKVRHQRADEIPESISVTNVEHWESLKRSFVLRMYFRGAYVVQLVKQLTLGFG